MKRMRKPVIVRGTRRQVPDVGAPADPCHPASGRLYCWRVGAALEMGVGERCRECGSVDHREVPDDALCHAFARCDADHGHPCELPDGHAEPRHACPEAARECRAR